MRQAEKFGRPVVCLVDTQGAFCGMEAEERGQGNAIADNLLAMAGLRVPVVSVLLGEGGSGGALALALADRVAMQEHAVYSVLSPEGFASILWKDRTRAARGGGRHEDERAPRPAAMGIVDAVLSEGAAPRAREPRRRRRERARLRAGRPGRGLPSVPARGAGGRPPRALRPLLARQAADSRVGACGEAPAGRCGVMLEGVGACGEELDSVSRLLKRRSE